MKSLFTGELSGRELADRVCLPYALLEALVEHLRVEKLIEVRGAAGSGTAGFRYALTDQGRDRAAIYFDASGYVGPAPVPLKQYTAAMNDAQGAERIPRLRAPRARIHAPRHEPRDA